MITDSLWLDEATTALVSQMSLKDIFVKFLPNDFHPPLYYLIMKGWVSMFGASEISLRAPSVIFALLTIYLVYKMSGKVAGLLLATSPLFFYYAQEARMYMMTTFLVSLLVYLFKHKNWVWFSVFLAVLGLTDYIALFIVPVFLILNYKKLKSFILYLLPLSLAYLWWGSYFLTQLKGGLAIVNSNWGQLLGIVSFKNFALIPVKFMIGRISFDDKYLYAAIVVILGLIFGYLLFKARKSETIYWLWLVLPLLIGFLVSFKVPTLTYFRFLFCLPAFYILISEGIKNSRKFNKLLLALILCVNVIFSMFYILNSKFHKEDWRGIAVAIENDQIVTPTVGQREALIYYGKKDQIVDQPTQKVVWLSRYVWEIFDPTDSARLKIEKMGYNKISEHNFNGVLFFKYENRN